MRQKVLLKDELHHLTAEFQHFFSCKDEDPASVQQSRTAGPPSAVCPAALPGLVEQRRRVSNTVNHHLCCSLFGSAATRVELRVREQKTCAVKLSSDALWDWNTAGWKEIKPIYMNHPAGPGPAAEGPGIEHVTSGGSQTNTVRHGPPHQPEETS